MNIKHAWQEDIKAALGASAFLGKVTATPGSGTVTFKRYPDAAAETQPKLATYTPTVDDIVLVLRVGAGWVVIGDIG
jgi:hypothetical protein